MTKFKKIALTIAAAGLAVAGLTACQNDSDVVSKNLSTDADNFKVFRQIVVYNAITDTYVQEIQGFCALGNSDSADRVTYTCKSPEGYVKDIILKSDNTFVFVHQLHPKNVSDNFFKVTLKPSVVVPEFELH